jgi:hypothetical protein
LTVKDAVQAATTGALPNATYFNTPGDDSGVGAGFDFSTGLDSLDSVPLVAGYRILVKDQANLNENGIYVWDSATRITRATDADSHGELGGGVFVFVEEGFTNASNGFVTSHTIFNHKVGVDSVVWTQFSGAGFIEAGEGLTKRGNIIDVNIGDNAGLVITGDKLNIQTGAGLALTSNVLKIDDDAIKDTMIDFGTGANQVSTDDVPEGSTNLYLSEANVISIVDSAYVIDRSKHGISVGTNLNYFGRDSEGLTYNSITGELSYVGPDSESIRGVFNGIGNIQPINANGDIQTVDSPEFTGMIVTGTIHAGTLIADTVTATSLTGLLDTIAGQIDSDYIEERRPAETIFEVSANGSSNYVWQGDGFPTDGSNSTLHLTRGKTYKFINSAYVAHPLYIQTSNPNIGGYQSGDILGTSEGVIGNGGQYIYYTVPMNAPRTLFYVCQNHATNMNGKILIDDAYSDGF